MKLFLHLRDEWLGIRMSTVFILLGLGAIGKWMHFYVAVVCNVTVVAIGPGLLLLKFWPMVAAFYTLQGVPFFHPSMLKLNR